MIVDEAKDLTEIGVRLAHRLVGDPSDGLLLVSDGQQSVYPSGYSLGAAGVNVVGRSVVLRTNDRNTAEVLAAAMRVVEYRPLHEGEDIPTSGTPEVVVLRAGEPAIIEGYPTSNAHDEEMWGVSVRCVLPAHLTLQMPSSP